MSISEPRIVQVRIQRNSAYYKERLSDIELPQNSYILGLVRGFTLITVDENPLILEQDIIIAVATNPAFGPLLKHRLVKTRAISWSSVDNYLHCCPV